MMSAFNIEKREDLDYIKKITLIVSFFIITPGVIAICLFSIFSINKTSKFEQQVNLQNYVNPTNNERSGVRLYASLPKDTKTISATVESSDARVEILKAYLRKYYSPLEPYAEILVTEADNNSLDYRLLTAIAQQESNLCKRIPDGTFNCWGWGIHSKGTLGFESYEQGIQTVSKGIKDNYIDTGFLTVEDIMTKYTPLSNGSWAQGVNEFMNEIENVE